ncbi:DUF4376 domain-containing protein [Mesorhizobium amorphae]|uniref:DUF4376 domain-containing protein n=1 Tax=Mesorhizobium amorphae TaxID=71433 RepID=UPI001643586D|nr:DUF4376 domain-containing protein [Mesorhizobium amorphae]
MKVYHFNTNNKLLTGVADAHPNPMREGEFLIPAFATDIAPPSLASNEAAKWETDHWTIVPIVMDPGTGDLEPVNLTRYAADVRWRLEVGGTGIVFENISIPLATDRDSQVKAFAARYQADQDPQFTINWKCADGNWKALNATTIQAASNAILQHVKRWFDAEQVVVQKIVMGEITTVSQIDAAFAAM